MKRKLTALGVTAAVAALAIPTGAQAQMTFEAPQPILNVGGIFEAPLPVLTNTQNAQGLTSVGPSCEDWVGGGWIDCGGAFMGNNANQNSLVEAWIASNFSINATLVGTTDADAGPAGPFNAFSGGMTSGTLTFDNTVFGPFVLGLKAADKFSLYLFDAGQAGWNTVDFNTVGTSLNRQLEPHALSHASLYYVGSTVMVPEPGTVVLLGTGLLGLGLVTWRRREQELS